MRGLAPDGKRYTEEISHLQMIRLITATSNLYQYSHITGAHVAITADKCYAKLQWPTTV